jgi:hypothetical protein
MGTQGSVDRSLAVVALALLAFSAQSCKSGTESAEPAKPANPVDTSGVEKYLQAVRAKDVEMWLSTLRCYQRDVESITEVAEKADASPKIAARKQQYTDFFQQSVNREKWRVADLDWDIALFARWESQQILPGEATAMGGPAIRVRLAFPEGALLFEDKRIKAITLNIPVAGNQVRCMSPAATGRGVRINVSPAAQDMEFY